ncbi:Dabb family protein [Cellulophaga fucicola]|uniref:Dabb family protein n=1 Tax=Cellulophaga fucicola TaxID=76595 RepID=UPI003EBC45B1
MKNLAIFICISLSITCYANKPKDNIDSTVPNKILMQKQDSVLRHVVIFKFKPDATKEQITNVEKAFSALPSKIPQIMSYEWGLNNSPEGLSKGFTHCFFVTFKNEKDRATYLPHPDHKAFGTLLNPILEDVFVLDYWSN